MTMTPDEGDGERRTRAEEEEREGHPEGDERAAEDEVRELGVGPSRERLASKAQHRAPNRRHLLLGERDHAVLSAHPQLHPDAARSHLGLHHGSRRAATTPRAT